MKAIDLTHIINEDMPVYPGTEPPKLTPANSYEKDAAKPVHPHRHPYRPAGPHFPRWADAGRVPAGAVHRQGAGHRLPRH